MSALLLYVGIVLKSKLTSVSVEASIKNPQQQGDSSVSVSRTMRSVMLSRYSVYLLRMIEPYRTLSNAIHVIHDFISKSAIEFDSFWYTRVKANINRYMRSKGYSDGVYFTSIKADAYECLVDLKRLYRVKSMTDALEYSVYKYLEFLCRSHDLDVCSVLD